MSEKEHSTNIDVKALAEVVREAGALAVETSDYVSYATVLDLRVGGPDNYTAESANEVLEALYETLVKYDELTYGVGWDVPALVLPFLKLCHGDFGRTHLLKTIKDIFTHLCLHGNHKELFLKSSELLLRLSDEEDDELSDSAISGGSITSNSETERGDNSDSEPEGGNFVDEEPPIPAAQFRDYASLASRKARLRDVKTQMLYELMRISLSYIDTKYPSRFFKTAATTLLTVASDPDSDIPTLTTHLRNLFLFGRDFEMESTGASEDEARKTGILLQNYLTHASEVTMERVAIRWADRLYYQLVNKIALAAPKARDAAYHTNLYTERINEAMARLAQLAQSYDLDLTYSWCDLVLDAVKKSVSSVDDEPEDILDIPSPAGLLLLATQSHFDGMRAEKCSLAKAVEVCNVLAESVHQSLGVRDALLYWILWTSTSATAEDVQALKKDDYCHFLQLIFSIANGVNRESRHIAYSAVTKLLRLQNSEIAFDFLIDTFEYCPYDNVLDAAVQMLKVLVTGKVKCQIGMDAGQCREIVGNQNPAYNLLVLDSTKKEQILKSVSTCIDDFVYGSDSVPLVLSWLNFLTVVEVDNEQVKEVVAKLRIFIDSEEAKKLPDNVSGLIKLALESLEKARF